MSLISRTVNLAEEYPFLGQDGAAPRLECHIQQYERLGEEIVRPAALILPGGSYTHHGLRETTPVALEFMNEGYQAFVLYYSVTPHHYPQQILEVAAALDYIKKHFEHYRIDPERIVLIGFSAGGHLAACYSSFSLRPEVKRIIDPPRVGAVLLGYPLIYAQDVITLEAIERFAGREHMNDRELQRMSPGYNIRRTETPPTFLWHTNTDRVVSVESTLMYARELIVAGVPTELHLFPDGPHALSTATRQTVKEPYGKIAYSVSSWVRLAKRWLENLFDL